MQEPLPILGRCLGKKHERSEPRGSGKQTLGTRVKSQGHFSCSQPEGRTSQFKHLWVLEEMAFGSQSHSRAQGSSPVLLEKKFRAMVSKNQDKEAPSHSPRFPLEEKEQLSLDRLQSCSDRAQTSSEQSQELAYGSL